MNAHPEAAETAADEALETPDPAAEDGRDAPAGPDAGRRAAGPAAAAARWLDLWESALEDLARRGPPG
ncbi:MAG TPA: hypothetical protein VJ994_10075 [Paracoccaceae bacterium]|nr:hypothetical protein [Paracoccaceae bacterium]